jgi:hypothetical protein
MQQLQKRNQKWLGSKGVKRPGGETDYYNWFCNYEYMEQGLRFSIGLYGIVVQYQHHQPQPSGDISSTEQSITSYLPHVPTSQHHGLNISRYIHRHSYMHLFNLSYSLNGYWMWNKSKKKLAEP